MGDVGDIMFVNPKYYVTGTRGGIDTEMSIHLRFDYNESVFRFLFEVDGQPWLNSPITPLNSTVTKSAFVAVAAR